MSIRLDGKRVLVTGGTRGIGRSLSLAFADAGADLVACGRSDREAARSLAEELEGRGGNHHVLHADVSSPEQVDTLLDECRTRLGGLDVLVSNAGAISHVPFSELTLDEWRRVIDTNLTAAYLLVSRALPLLSEGGSIVLVGSRSAQAGIPLRAHYTASKAGLVGLSRSLAKELGPQGIRVNVVAPGVIETADKPLNEEIRARYERLTALGRLGQGEEVAGPVLFLASSLSAYMTGETLHVDGGI
ncbi:SDR family NAD(P)-dependent oxidoreductase [Streptomyces polychromogenes]|uniref:SDR family NAD(P)-dependent oxidoreductase n=1 Tax=Streptomyces polychromogenes TaxID=67342 RepID=A0ABP3F2Y8_9ACTN